MTRIVQIAPAIAPGSGVAGVALHTSSASSRPRARPSSGSRAAEAGRRRDRRRGAGRRSRRTSSAPGTSSGSARSARGARAASSPSAPTPCRSATTTSWPATSTSTTACCRRRCARAATTPGAWCAIPCTCSRRSATASATAVARTARSSRSRRPRPTCCVSTYGRVRAPIHVIPNGVDLERFRPPDADGARALRARRSASTDDRTVAVFVGHEFERKGLPLAIEALRRAPDVHAPRRRRHARDDPQGAARRREHARRRRPRASSRARTADPIPFLRASDVFVLPSAYEANALVVLEALACGLPVVCDPVGFAPDIVVDGENGYLVDRDAAAVGDSARRALDRADLDAWRARARQTAERYAWPRDRAAVPRARRVAASAERSGATHDATALRILHAIRSDGFAGVEQFVLRLAIAQAADGHDVAVIGGATDRMRAGLDQAGVAHTPAARTDRGRSAPCAGSAHGVDVVNTHMTAADVGAVAALASGGDRAARRRRHPPLREAARPARARADRRARAARHRRPDLDQRRRRRGRSTARARWCTPGVEPRPLGDGRAARRDRAHGAAAPAGEAHAHRHPRVRGIRARRRRLDARDRRRTGRERGDAARRSPRTLGLARCGRLPRVPRRPARRHGSRRPAARALPGRGARPHRARGDGGRPARRRRARPAGTSRCSPASTRARCSRPTTSRPRPRGLRSLADDDAGRDGARRRRTRAPAARLLAPRAGRRHRAGLPEACCDRSRGDVARALGRRVAPQPAPRRRAAAARPRPARALRRAARRSRLHDLRVASPAALGRGVADGRRQVAPVGCWTLPAREVAAAPARPHAPTTVSHARSCAAAASARHAASAAVDQRPGRRDARAVVRLADALRHHRRLARGRPTRGRTRAHPRRTRHALLERRARGRGVLARAGAAQGARARPVDAHPERRRRRGVPDARRRGPPTCPPGRSRSTSAPSIADRIDVDLCEATARALGTHAARSCSSARTCSAPDEARAPASARALGCSAPRRATRWSATCSTPTCSSCRTS